MVIAMGFRLPYDTFAITCTPSIAITVATTVVRATQERTRMEAGRHEAGAGHDRESNMKYARDQA